MYINIFVLMLCVEFHNYFRQYVLNLHFHLCMEVGTSHGQTDKQKIKWIINQVECYLGARLFGTTL